MQNIKLQEAYSAKPGLLDNKLIRFFDRCDWLFPVGLYTVRGCLFMLRTKSIYRHSMATQKWGTFEGCK